MADLDSTQHFAIAKPLTLSNCDLCGTPTVTLVTNQAAQDYSVCQSALCKQVLSKKNTMPSALFANYLTTQRQAITEAKTKAAQIQQYQSKIDNREAAENEQIKRTVLRQLSATVAGNMQVIPIPRSKLTVTKLPKERITAYTQHLTSIIQQAAACLNSPDVTINEYSDIRRNLLQLEQKLADNPAVSAVSDKLCGLCKGGCCSRAGNKAYLAAANMKRFMQLNPDWSQEEILATYLSYISEETIEGNCINQTATGCALPRELRSDVCNNYYCEPLQSYQAKFIGKETGGKVLAIQRDNDRWNRYERGYNNIINVALITAQDTQLLDIADN